jgi:hypothetical protein
MAIGYLSGSQGEVKKLGELGKNGKGDILFLRDKGTQRMLLQPLVSIVHAAKE